MHSSFRLTHVWLKLEHSSCELFHKINNPILKLTFINRNVYEIKNDTEAANCNPCNSSVIYITLCIVVRQKTDFTQTCSCVCNMPLYKFHLNMFQWFVSYRQQTKIGYFTWPLWYFKIS
jgi:hypothetical protein